MDIEINISRVIEEKDKLTDLTARLKEIAQESIKETNTLKENWESKNSEGFYSEFEKYAKDFNVLLEDNVKLINYLQEIVANGYLYENNLYKSLSGVAKAITGKSWNGNVFFGGRNE